MPTWAVAVLGHVSLQRHFANIARGVMDSRDVLYFLSIIALALLWSTRTVEARKWK
jgi:ABC-2 type transport system permease protein